MILREETTDAKILESIMAENEYDLPESFSEDDLIVDVGAHIGIFAYACLIRGVGFVHCLEVGRENAELLVANLRPFDRRRWALTNAAVWGAGDPPSGLSVNESNPGASTLVDGTPSETIAGSVPILAVLKNLGEYERIRLLKIDCEGAEHEILHDLQPEELSHVDEIVGEAHDLSCQTFSEAVDEYRARTGNTWETLRDSVEERIRRGLPESDRYQMSLEEAGKAVEELGLARFEEEATRCVGRFFRRGSRDRASRTFSDDVLRKVRELGFRPEILRKHSDGLIVYKARRQ